MTLSCCINGLTAVAVHVRLAIDGNPPCSEVRATRTLGCNPVGCPPRHRMIAHKVAFSGCALGGGPADLMLQLALACRRLASLNPRR